MINELRMLIRQILVLEKKSSEKKDKNDDGKKNILTEPDEVEERDDDKKEDAYLNRTPSAMGYAVGRVEASMGGVAGVSTPLGTGPTFPLKKKKKKKKK